ncbi:hypothetical protein CKAN_01041900 [Cinnamomum micranthum f. kanehirae]|uniref:Uncharacterized protein n=1 Tax=Cinnamomum micranthum f. kanehirae TaxID=337451 RepID=A0A3S3MY05_9MAGN|nr:hypothetical protein CKAN_01041900 [Cinnamomum micranthum f. kanehirae]
MKKRAGAKLNSNSKNGVSPLPLSCPNRNTPPKPYEFKVTRFTSSKKKTAPAHAPSPFLQPQNPSPSNKNPATISDLKDLAASRANSIKRCLDLCHSEILKEIEASNSRLSKRFKIQSQACLQVMDEAEKEYKKMTDRISENIEVMQASYSEFITEAQAQASRVCKVTIPELTQSLEKGIECLRNRYGVPLMTA